MKDWIASYLAMTDNCGATAGGKGCDLVVIIVIMITAICMALTQTLNDLFMRIDHDEIDELVYGDIKNEDVE